MDRDPQTAIELQQQGHHPPARSLTANVDVRILDVAHEAVTPSFQFLVHLIQQHVREKRTALRRPHLPLLHLAIHLNAAVPIGADQPDPSGVSDPPLQPVDEGTGGTSTLLNNALLSAHYGVC
jgi:hypothetical protein